jgi:transmembrane sensor
MSNLLELPQKITRHDQASNWIARIDRGLDTEESESLRQWLDGCDQNRAALMDIARLWDRMDVLSRLATICPDTTERPTRLLRYALPVSAAAIVFAIIGSWGFFREGIPDRQTMAETWSTRYETAVGELASLQLRDGTQLVLNTNSRVLVDYTGSNRVLNLERGEMHVKVAYDRTRPLSVVIGGTVVQAVGTEFNVEIKSSNNIELVVTEGVVMVGIRDASVGGASPDRPIVLTPSSTLVAAGQEVVIDGQANDETLVRTETIDNQEIAVKLSWREGNLIFRGESLEEAVSEIGRYTTVAFVFLDDESRKVRVAGLFKAGDVDGLLSALRQNFHISYEWVGDDTVVLSGE